MARVGAGLWPAALLRPRAAPEPSPRERVLAQRERLLISAVQILHDPQAALEVVLESLGHALRSPLLVQVSGVGLPATASPPPSGALEDPLSRWLDRLIVNQALLRLRSGPMAPPRPGEEPSTLAEVLRRAGQPPEQKGPRAQSWPSSEVRQLEQMARHLLRISPEARVTVALVVMQGRSPGEAAELLGCSEASCRFWLNHGRKQLRRALQQELLAEGGTPEPRPPLPLSAAHDLRRGKKTAARA